MSLNFRNVLVIAAMGLVALGAIASEVPDTPEHVVGDSAYPFNTVDPRVEEKEAIELPDSVVPKLELLTPGEIAFLESGEAGSFEDVVKELEERSPEDIKAWVGAMQYVYEHNRYREGRDSPNVPFNTASPEFNAWKTERPRSMDPPREDGPLPLGRYDGEGGPPTFGGYPLALTKKDLVAGEVDVAIIGAPLNMGSGWRDSGEKATVDLRLLGWPMGGMDQYVQIDASEVLTVVDYGDVAVDNDSTERSMQHVRDIVREIAETGAIPMVVGGDHSLEYPNVAALADVYGKEKVSVIHFDSHYDAWWGGSHLISHGYPVYRLINEGHVRAADYIQVGLRSSGPDKSGFEWMREQGMRYHTMAEIHQRGFDNVLERVLQEVENGPDAFFVSIDVSVINPTDMLAAGRITPNGLHVEEVTQAIRHVCAAKDIVVTL